ncbi:hypothetical protein ACFU5D_16340 [Streptomyces anthocyanicus]|uniref:hypothetical protein n=1 Tax=Streptomyces anthocyanicus TaxID=68174 RepID=UPI00368841E2
MSTPKTIYPQSEARRLCEQPCIHCGKLSRIDRKPLPDMRDSVPDPDVSVLWYCPNNLCEGHDGFSIENQ